MRKRERRKRRKRELPKGSDLGHTVKSRMTVISRWSAIMIPKPIDRHLVFSSRECRPSTRLDGRFFVKSKGKQKGGFSHGNFYRSRRGNRHTDAC